MRRLSSVITALVLVAACGGDPPTGGARDGQGGDPTPATSDDPCALATADMVVAAFGGAAGEGQPGAARNCTFEITGGTDTSVVLFHYGLASGWDGTRDGFEENREGTTDVPGLGAEAFYPNDRGPRELVVHAAGVIFSVSGSFFGPDGPQVDASILTLAQAIAAQLGG